MSSFPKSEAEKARSQPRQRFAVATSARRAPSELLAQLLFGRDTLESAVVARCDGLTEAARVCGRCPSSVGGTTLGASDGAATRPRALIAIAKAARARVSTSANATAIND